MSARRKDRDERHGADCERITEESGTGSRGDNAGGGMEKRERITDGGDPGDSDAGSGNAHVNVPDGRIVKFIRRHHVLTLGTCRDGKPWCANIFYAYMPEANLFVYTTDPKTRHGREAAGNPEVSASIVLETKVVGRVRGLQITGRTRQAGEQEAAALRKAYLKRFPYAAAAKLDLWALEPHSMKFTDNTLGFGKKLAWEK